MILRHILKTAILRKLCFSGLTVLWWSVAMLPAQDMQSAGSTIRLTPATIVDFALSGNVTVQTSRYSHQLDVLARKSAFAGLLPVVKMKGSYIHLEKQPWSDGTPIDVRGSIPDSLRFLLDAGDTLTLGLLNQLLNGMSAPRPVGLQDMWNLGVTITQPVFTGGMLLNSLKTADDNVRIAALRQERTKQEVRAEALQLFWTYVGKRESIGVLTDNISWLEQLYTDQVALAQNGMITDDDMLRTKTALGFSRVGLVTAQDSLQDLQETILLYCNLPSTTVILLDSLSLGELDRSVTVPDPYNVSIVDNRKDVQALYAQVRSLSTVRNILMSAYAPQIYGVYGYDWKNTNPVKPHHMSGGWSVGVAVDWTLWDWLKNRREIEKVEIRIAQLRLSLDAQVEAIRAQARRAARAIATSVEIERLSLESLDNAQRGLDHAARRYNEGLITSQDLLTSRKDLTLAQQGLIGSHIARVLAVEAFNAAVGQ